MKLLLTLILLTSAQANAGWFKNWCEKTLIADDPTQFETASTDWVIKAYISMRTKDRWNRLPEEDHGIYAILKRELENRVQYGKPEDVDRIMEVLKAE